MIVYKILPAAEWEQVRQVEQWSGSEVDLRDGYIHFSSADQVAETVRKHFSAAKALVVLALPENFAGLVWEPSRGGALFPHLYRPLTISAVASAEPYRPTDPRFFSGAGFAGKDQGSPEDSDH